MKKSQLKNAKNYEFLKKIGLTAQENISFRKNNFQSYVGIFFHLFSNCIRLFFYTNILQLSETIRLVTVIECKYNNIIDCSSARYFKAYYD